MNRTGTIARTEGGGFVLHYERIFPQTPADVWAALTEPSVLSRWLLSRVDVDLHIGGRFVIHFFEGLETMTGTILALEPGHLIEYSWIEDGAPELRVRWTVAPEGDGARLTLTHFLPAGSTAALVTELGGGWHGLLDFLATCLDGGRPVYNETERFAREARYRDIFRKEFGA